MTQARDYFSILGLMRHYRLDYDELRKAYHCAQQQTHPDNAIGGKAKQQAIADAALVNEAYRVLKTPVLRALYFLQINGIEPQSAVLSETFLENQLTLREAAENALHDRDEETIDRLLMQLTEASRQRQEMLAHLLDDDSLSCENLRQALPITMELQFLERFREDLEEKKEYADEA